MSEYNFAMRMSKESKFGYGFLLAGIGLPFLIDKLLGPLAAVIIAGVCTLAGLAFLVSGHFHRDKEPIGFAVEKRRYMPTTITIVVLVALAVSLFIAIRRFYNSANAESSTANKTDQHGTTDNSTASTSAQLTTLPPLQSAAPETRRSLPNPAKSATSRDKPSPKPLKVAEGPVIPDYEEGAPNAGPEDPQLMRDAKLAAMQRPELASKITDISRKMREYERSWQWIGPNPPDSPPVGHEDTEEFKQQMAIYQQELAEWHKKKDEEPATFRNRFFQNFSNDLLVIGELDRRTGQVSKSNQCGLLFGGIPFEKGDLLICADYLDDVVRRNLD